MREQLEERLEQLKQELLKGQQRLEQLEAEKNQLTQTVLRISGAIQVLEEELSRDTPVGDNESVLNAESNNLKH